MKGYLAVLDAAHRFRTSQFDGDNAIPPVQLAMRTLFASVIGIFVAAHLILLFVYNSPDNALKIDTQDVQTAYIGRIFQQNWSFFAPAPIDRNAFLVVRARADDFRTPWINVSSQLITAVQHNRLSPYELVATGVMNAINDLSIEFADKDHRKHISSFLKSSLDMRVLVRTAAALTSMTYPGRHFDEIQCALVVQDVPRFTHRKDPLDPHKQYSYSLGTYRFPAVVSF